MKKILAALLAITLILTSTLPTLAASPTNESINPRFAHINLYYLDLEIDETTGISNSYAECYADKNYTVEVECSLEQYIAARWTTIKLWSSRGSRYAYIDQDWAVYSGYSYRIYVAFRIYDANGNLCESVTDNDVYVYPSRN